MNLVDIEWLHLGSTDEYDALKKSIAHICRDVTESSCINELCIHDILVTFKRHGYDVTKINGSTSDGYHTFDELYEARMAYNVALFNEWAENIEWEDIHSDPIPVEVPKHDVHKSKRHHDGELCFGGGWFIVVANLPSGQISNHYEMKHWDLFRVPSYEKAKYEFDGHTSEDVVKRLLA